ncbi:hypothetical protein [Rathayibacter iranicus]|uniref:Uncharacterized protein n=2 Tax=Rathayibacter iranicus TaxID=59737 RepID=A0AAD1EMW4_9MICO|nr:hypothetical protein [Rathayibacter iranicus]AZZ56521.1 hypothetical protein C7V51_12010 [Rathayibacter iranicus]MWV31937.1 hypothetical protein [Rathayibacter iranicus NCPPB 2253 = VKM Ac-1602]PPI43752.1 hypothetical protein C5E09_10935 [Rathayibacter iranicus]PPI58907.1 hypothetical protein C5E08_11850 [Rathayibacter iranicus]PPI69859.1 hypothetical protein C5E01_10900 [Rathayibacter iranicus]
MTEHDVPLITVPLGRPVAVEALRYTAMYGLRPFPEALLILFDNGSYKIVSEGEDHFGSYVSATGPGEALRHIAFLSWPSADWDRNVASHTLTFEPETGAFIQTLRLPAQPVPHAQHGFAAAVEAPESVDLEASWDQVRVTYDAVFAGLLERATRH